MILEPNISTLVALLVASFIMWIKTDIEAKRLRNGQKDIRLSTNGNLGEVKQELADARKMLVASLQEIQDLKERIKSLTAQPERPT